MPKAKSAKFQHAIMENLEYVHLGLGDVTKIKTEPIMYPDAKKDIERPDLFYLSIFKDPEHIYLACEYLFGIKLAVFQIVFLQTLFKYKSPMVVMTRGGGKTFLLGLYALLKAVFEPGIQIVIAGSVFRQSKLVWEHCQRIWNQSPIIRYEYSKYDRQGPHFGNDKVDVIVGKSKITGIPVGDGETIRGLRAQVIICDEFASHNEEILETVIFPFGAVTKDPADNIIEEAKRKFIKENLTDVESEAEVENRNGNQIIVAGTADYSFGHFYKYFQRYQKFIRSQGDTDILRTLFKDGIIPEGFNWRDYAIIRMPVEAMPDGFMDKATIARSKATTNSTIYMKEYSACFITDSEGFFRRSLIEGCTAKPDCELGPGRKCFTPLLNGDMKRKYVIGVDPASENDNFAIIVLEIHDNHRRIVYCWTTTAVRHKEILKARPETDHDFYRFCARKIRDLMKMFPVCSIAIDSQGGGKAVTEALHDPKHLELYEDPIWPVIEIGKPKETDSQAGPHIIEIINFADAKWTSDANHGMKMDMENKTLLFPYIDAVTFARAAQEERVNVQFGNESITMYGSMEECILEIEELKNELCIIEHSRTPTGNRERWDVPDKRVPGAKKGKPMRKDRYSALVMANMIGRQILNELARPAFPSGGGFADSFKGGHTGNLYHDSEWSAACDGAIGVVRR